MADDKKPVTISDVKLNKIITEHFGPRVGVMVHVYRNFARDVLAAASGVDAVDLPQRYDYGFAGRIEGMSPRKDGKYVKWEDVAHLFGVRAVDRSLFGKQKSQPPLVEAVLQTGTEYATICERIGEGRGGEREQYREAFYDAVVRLATASGVKGPEHG
jgi:hypothetical protein